MNRRRFRWVAAAALAAILACPAVAAAEAVEGKCIAGEPYILSGREAVKEALARGARLGCNDWGEVTLTYGATPIVPAGGVVTPPEVLFQRPQPADFDGWVFIWINGRQLVNPRPEAGRYEPDAYIVRSTGRTVMPVRFFTEAIGGQVDWDEARRRVTLTLERQTVELWVGSREARVNGRPLPIDQAPFIWDGRTMLPTRFLLEAFGATVAWDPANASVWVELPEAACTRPAYCAELDGGDA